MSLVGRDGMGLPMKHAPIKLQVRIEKDYQGAYILLVRYLREKFPFL